MCPPLLFGTAAATAATSATGAFVASTAGLLGSGGAFNLATGTLTSGLFSGGAGSLFNVGSMLVQGVGQLYSGAQQSANYEYQARMAEYNRRIYENNAIMAEREAEDRADASDERIRALMGTQATRYASSGVVINQDTPLNLAINTATAGAQERLNILYSGKTSAAAARQGAVGQTAAAQNFRSSADSAFASSAIGAAGTVAKGAYEYDRRYGTAGKGLLS